MFKESLFKLLKIALFRDLFIGLITTFKYLFKRRVTLNYPNEKGGFYEKRIDTDNAKIYDEFVLALSEVNNRMKEIETPKVSKLKLPKLKKLDG